tara:strand:- start:24588 stop:26663 length:2076 start_codon:yes stop_codon:yes gene_type:complete
MFICALCKYSKNSVNVNELFRVAQQQQAPQVLELNLNSNINIIWPNCLDSDNNIQTLELSSITADSGITFNQAVNLLQSISIRQFEDRNNQLKLQIGSNVSQLTNDFSGIDTDGQKYIDETNETDDTVPTCSGYIKPMKENEILGNNIIDFIANIFVPFNKKIDATKSSDDGNRQKLIDDMKAEENSIDNIKTNINHKFDTIIEFLSQQDTGFKKIIENNRDSQLSKLSEVISNFNKLNQIIDKKITEENNDILTINDNLNINGDSNDPRYVGKSSDGQSLKEHCFINPDGNHVCDNKGCVIECEWKDEDGKCTSSDDLGEPNPTTYTNVLGSSIDIAHKHPHTHESNIPIEPFVFTNCGKTGRNGPSQKDCDNTYGSGVVSMENDDGKQLWKVPVTGNYMITTIGSNGNDRYNSKTLKYNNGGKGYLLKAKYSLNKNDELKIIVGHKGLTSEYGAYKFPGSGGGGSFIWKKDNDDWEILIVAGGGGGGAGGAGSSLLVYGEEGTNSAGGDAGFEFGDKGVKGTDGIIMFTDTDDIGGAGGFGGSRYIIPSDSGAGLKLNSDVKDSTVVSIFGEKYNSYLIGAKSAENTAIGGLYTDFNGYTNEGGFGGGGSNGLGTAGGGGGYYGGNKSSKKSSIMSTATNGGGGGGSSYVNEDIQNLREITDNRVATSDDGGDDRDGYGRVIIEYLGNS